MKKINKVIAAMMIMAITTAPAMAANNVDRNAYPGKKEMKMSDRNLDRHRGHMKALDMMTFKVSKTAARHKDVVATAKAVRGVKEVNYNPRTGVMRVTYDTRVTSAHRIKAAVN